MEGLVGLGSRESDDRFSFVASTRFKTGGLEPANDGLLLFLVVFKVILQVDIELDRLHEDQ